MKTIYNLAVYIGAAVFSPAVLWRLAARPGYRKNFSQRLGFSLPRAGGKTIWIHAVSVGEALAARPLVREIKKLAPDIAIAVSTATPTGRDVAEKNFSDTAAVFYFPYDLPGAVKRAVEAINPAVFATIDTEIWPNMIWALKARGARAAIVNGRISDRSYPRYKRLKWLFGEVLSGVDLFLMQGDEDARRIADIGAPSSRVETAGNIKFDGVAVSGAIDSAALRRSAGIGPDEKVIFLGSVHEGEDNAIRAAVNAAKNIGGARIVIAPRRIENIGWIERALEGTGLTAVRKTSLPPAPVIDKAAVPVIDTFGELSALYSIADVVFVGGSMIDHGGQNPLEPAAHGIAPLFGPSMSNFRDAAAALLSAGGAWKVGGADELENMFIELLRDDGTRKKAGAAARGVVEKNRGAAKRAAERIVELAAVR